MTNNEAISRIKFLLDVGGSDGFTYSDKKALNAAINALSECKKPKTNADRIRQMTDEELAEWLDLHGECNQCAYHPAQCKTECNEGHLKWRERRLTKMPELMTKKDAIEYLLYMKHDVYAKSPMDIALDTAIEALKQPTIEPEVRHGRWIERECYSVHGEEHADYECSHCRCIIERKKFCVPPWCQWCGTKMDGGADND